MNTKIFIKDDENGNNNNLKYVGSSFFEPGKNNQKKKIGITVSKKLIITLIVIVLLILSLFYFFADERVNNEFTGYKSKSVKFTSYQDMYEVDSFNKNTVYVLIGIILIGTVTALILSYIVIKKIGEPVVLISNDERSNLIQNFVFQNVNLENIEKAKYSKHKVEKIKKDLKDIRSAQKGKNEYSKISSKDDYFGRFLSEFILELNKSILQLKNKKEFELHESRKSVLIKADKDEDKIIGF